MARETVRRRLVRLELGAAGRDVVVVVEELDLDRLRIRFNSGAELVVPASLTSTYNPEETPHGRPQRRPHRPPDPPAELDL